MAIEHKYFVWEEFDEIDCFGVQFYDCTLVADIDSEYKKGMKIDIISIDFENGYMELYSKDDESGIPYKTYKIELNIVK